MRACKGNGVFGLRLIYAIAFFIYISKHDKLALS